MNATITRIIFILALAFSVQSKMYIFKSSYALHVGDKYCIYEFGEFDPNNRYLQVNTSRINSYTNNLIAQGFVTNCAKSFRLQPIKPTGQEKTIDGKQLIVLDEYTCFESPLSIEDIMKLVVELHESERCQIRATLKETGPCENDYPQLDFVPVPCMTGVQKVVNQKGPIPLKMIAHFDLQVGPKKIV